MHLSKSKIKALTGLKKAQTHLGNVIKMLENDKYCVDVMQQNLSVMGLLKSAHQNLMAGHLNSCFKNAMCSNNKKNKEKMIEEILQVSKLLNR